MEKKLTGYASIDQIWLKQYPLDAYNDVTTGINKKMYDFMFERSCNPAYLNVDDIKRFSHYAIKYFGKEITYGEMFSNIQKMAEILKSYGIGKGDVVSLCLPNIPETIYLKYALNRIGAIANMIEPRHSSNSILSYVNNSNSKLLFVVLDACEVKIDPIIDKLKVDDVVVLSVADSLNIRDGLIPTAVNLKYLTKNINLFLKEKLQKNCKYKTLKEFSKWGNDFYGVLDTPFEENETATIVYTSGTTGSSKGAMLSNEAYNCMHKQLQYTTEFRVGDTFHGAIPFFSAYGSFCGMHNSLCSGQEIIMIPKFDPNRVAESLLQHKPNISFLVPGYWKAVTQDPKAQDADFSFLKIIVAGGDKMDPVTINKVNDFFKKHNCKSRVRVGYGCSEFGGATSVVPEGELYTPGSAGLVLPSCKFMVIDPETTKELKYNEEGEICISTPTMMLGYLNEPDETKQLEIYNNGVKYYRTGDKGYIDESGLVFVIDRYKRSMMRPDGHTVHATPIENKILEYPGVEQCCVVGLENKATSGVIPTAFVVLSDSITEDKNEFFRKVDEFCLTSLSERERAIAYTVISKMPFNLMGKIDYRQLEKNNLEELELTVVDDTFGNFSNNKSMVKSMKR